MLDAADRTERRRLTVMFCDLVDSDNALHAHGPRGSHAILRQYHDLCGSLIESRGGYVAQHLGDGLLAYFGHPDAHEDDATRAVHAGLQIVAEISHLAPAVPLPTGYALGVRVGIHTGEVVTADIGRGEQSERLALGDVPNIAARLQGLAARNSVLVSEGTRALSLDAVEFEHFGRQQLKGISTSIDVYQAVRRVLLRDSYHGTRTGRMVGRERELERLIAKFRDAGANGARLIRIVGDPGMGKTRLALAFEDSLVGERPAWLVCRCASDGSGSFLFPIAEMLGEWGNLSAEHVRGTEG